MEMVSGLGQFAEEGPLVLVGFWMIAALVMGVASTLGSHS